MMQEWLMPQLDDSDDLIYQQVGAPPHYHHLVRGYLSQHLPQRWIGRTAANDQALLRWPPRSPDLTPCDFFFLWGYNKDSVFVPPLPWDLPKLRRRIIAAISSIDCEMLRRVWAEIDYRLDVCHITKGGHIGHL
jgi:hypothetical protein